MGNAVPEPRTPGTDADAKPTAPSEPRAVAAAGAGDARAILLSVVGSIGLATLMLMLAGLAIQQNAGVNARIDDLQQDVRELRTLIIAAVERPDPVDVRRGTPAPAHRPAVVRADGSPPVALAALVLNAPSLAGCRRSCPPCHAPR